MKSVRVFKIMLALLIGAVIVVAFAACQRDAEAQPLRIGVAGAHSGDLASYGLPTVNAAELVAEMYNENGGINGSRIQLFIEDDVCQPEVAANTAAKLVGDGVVAVIGHICSGATFAALGTYLDSDILAISPSATAPDLTQSGDYPNFFRTIASDDAQARMQVEFALDTLGAQRIAVLHDRGDYGRGLAENARDFIEGDGRAEVVVFDGVTPGAVDYSAIIARIEQSNADAIIYGGYHPEASRIVGQMRDRGMGTLFISGDGVKDDTFIQTAGPASEGVYATGPMDLSGNPVAVEAAQRHRDKYGEEPGPFFLEAYAAALALFNAIEIGGTTYEGITNALRNNTVDTSVGPVRFDARGDAEGVGFAVYQVQNGEYVELR